MTALDNDDDKKNRTRKKSGDLYSTHLNLFAIRMKREKTANKHFLAHFKMCKCVLYMLRFWRTNERFADHLLITKRTKIDTQAIVQKTNSSHHQRIFGRSIIVLRNQHCWHCVLALHVNNSSLSQPRSG